MTTKSLLIESIRVDGGTQGRETINNEHVQDLRSVLASGRALPPMLVFFDGEDYWLSDGFHRYYAHLEEGIRGTQVDIRKGTKRDAWIACLAANQGHGLRRTSADKRRLVMMALADDELNKWSSRKLADHIGVSHELVNSLRPGQNEARFDLRGRQYDPKPAPAAKAATSGQPPGNKMSTPDLRVFRAGMESSPQGMGATTTAVSGPCIRTGDEHEWGPDEDREGHYCCLQCGEPAEESDAPEQYAAEPSKLFQKAHTALGALVRAIDELHREVSNHDCHDTILDLLNNMNQELKLWKDG